MDSTNGAAVESGLQEVCYETVGWHCGKGKWILD